MDSDNSGSMQSSSSGGGGGGDQEEEYNSRSESIPTNFLNNPPTLSHFDNLNSKLVNPNYESSMLVSSAQYQSHQPLPFNLLSNIADVEFEVFSQYSQQPDPHQSRPQLLGSEATQLGTSTGSGSKSSTLQVGRNNVSKKRSRASRRAPTTVMNTDTSNFRAMVQEFTGIPAPPFSTSTSSFSRNRFDLFSSPTTTINGPPYPLLRPSPQKLHHSTSSSSSSPSLPFQSCLSSTNNRDLFQQPQILSSHYHNQLSAGFPKTQNNNNNININNHFVNPSLAFQCFPQNQYYGTTCHVVTEEQGSNLGLNFIGEEMNMRNHIGYVNANPHDSDDGGGILDSDQGNTILPPHNVSTITTTSWINSPSRQ